MLKSTIIGATLALLLYGLSMMPAQPATPDSLASIEAKGQTVEVDRDSDLAHALVADGWSEVIYGDDPQEDVIPPATHYQEETLVVPYGAVSEEVWESLVADGWEGSADDGVEALYPPATTFAECWDIGPNNVPRYAYGEGNC